MAVACPIILVAQSRTPAAATRAVAQTPHEPAALPIAGAVRWTADHDSASGSELTPPHRIELFTAPEGRAVAALERGARVVPVARDRGWRRVQITGWVREGDLVPADTSGMSGLGASDLRADPEGARGKTVRWEVQILSFQLADALRRDLALDEPYLLARGPGSESTLLYLAVPPSLVQTARAFPRASSAIITARVRNGRSEPVGVPILDLQSLARQ